MVLKGYPRLSETFIAEEIYALQNAGVALVLFSLRRPTDKKIHPVHRAITAPLNYLPEYLYREPLRVFRAWRKMRRCAGYRQLLRIWRRDLMRDRPRYYAVNRIRRFGQALVLAAELPDDVGLLYAHFLHTPASVARYAALLRNLPWSCSAHAKDIWTLPAWEKKEKLAACHWLTTCTRANFDHLRKLTDTPHKVSLNYHGLALSRFPSIPPPHSNRNGANRNGAKRAVRIISVGRAVDKKGYRGLLDALAALPKTLHWRMTHIGGGPLLAECKTHARALGIAAHIDWRGAQSQRAVIAAYRRADFFVLNCRIDKHGDRDGLPNVIVEAQSQGLAVLATDISGIPELIKNNVNGILVAADNPPALTAALVRMIGEPELRKRLGEAGRQIVFNQFDQARNFAPLHKLIIGDKSAKK